MIAIVADLLFVPVLVGVLAAYWHRRGPVERYMVLIFGTLAVFFLRDLARRTIGNLPAFANDLASAVVLAQSLLTLRLLSRLRPVSTQLMRAAALSYLVSIALLFAYPTPLPIPATVLIMGTVAALGAVATVMLVKDALRRTGSARVRLALAATATALFAVALLIAFLGNFAASLANGGRTTARVVGLAAALSYAAAFVPPRWLRRVWATTAAYSASQQLLRSSPDDFVDIWQRYAHVLREIRGADAAIVLLDSTRGFVEVAAAGLATTPVEYPAEEVHRMLAAPQPLYPGKAGDPSFLTAGFANRVNAAVVKAIALHLPSDRTGALVLLSRYRTMFIDDDISLLTDLGTQAGILAERGSVLAAQEQLSARLAASVGALTAANEAKTSFLANMSHELRTPLNAIIGFSDLMKRETVDGERTIVPTEWIEHINGSGRHLLELINDMLDLAKVEAGRMELRLEPVDVAPAIEAAVSTLRPLMVRKHLELHTENLGPCIAMADRLRLRQILDNVLSNAIKFTPEGGRISIAARADEDRVAISIADTGVGIAREDQVRVFEEFRQVGDRDTASSGTGLGLALTRRLVEAHGGTIEVESQLGQGARFTIRLPAAPASLDVVAIPVGGPADAGPDAHGSILVVEDEPGAVRLLRAYLEDAGYRVRVAVDGPGGLAAAQLNQPTAIVLDVMLPGLDGWEVLRQLKLDVRTRDIPVVMVTVVDEQEVGLALGAVDYLIKPVDPSVLLGVLARQAVIGGLRSSTHPIVALAIDDDPASLKIVVDCLSHQGMVVSTASNGADGLTLAQGGHFDVIVCDLLMPEIDGFMVIAELQASPATKNIPILVVTAQDLTEADKARLNGNILGIVQKGASLDSQLRQWLSQITQLAASVPSVGGVQ